MPTSFIFSQRDEMLLTDIVFRVRLMVLPQIATVYCQCDESNARRRCRELVRVGLLTQFQVRVALLPELVQPVAQWPADNHLDAGAISYNLQQRWAKADQRSLTAYAATARAAKRLGGPSPSRCGHSLQATHDVGLAAVFCHYRRYRPGEAERWIGEDCVTDRQYGDKQPDAYVLTVSRDAVEHIVEFGGAYNERRVAELIDFLQERELPFEIW